MEKIVFVMQLNFGCEVEYEKCYDEIWLELVDELKKVGIEDYFIFLYLDILQFFVVLWCKDDYIMDVLFVIVVM